MRCAKCNSRRVIKIKEGILCKRCKFIHYYTNEELKKEYQKNIRLKNYYNNLNTNSN
jgi:hypothetical protein